MKFSFSFDEENYSGHFDTAEEACKEAAAHGGVGQSFWVGVLVPPPAPESYWRAGDWLEKVFCQDEYSGDWAEGWDSSTKEQRAELDLEVQAVLARWLERHGLRPGFFNVEKPQRFYVAGKIGDVFEIEAL